MHSEICKGLFDCSNCLFRVISRTFISQEDFEIIRASSQQLRFKKGEPIIKQGARSSHVVYISKGLVKITYQNENNKELILSLRKAPNIVGGVNLFSEGHNVFSFVAVEDCDACLIDMSSILQVLAKNSSYALKLFELVSETSKDSIFNFINLSYKHVNGRVADVLIFLSKHIYNGYKFTLTLTRKELAQFAGVSQENLISTLSKFNKDGILNVNGKDIEVVNVDMLTKISKNG